MRTTRSKRVVSVVLALGAALSLLLFAAPASAAPPGTVITVGGSDTTEFIMSKIVTGPGEYTVEAVQETPVTVPGDAHCDTLTYDTDGPWPNRWTTSNTGGTKFVASPPLVPPNTVYGFPFPNGSSNGRAALRDSVNHIANTSGTTSWPPAADGGSVTQNGCIDIARSSSTPSTSADGPYGTKRYFGFALDALMWGTTSLNAPNTLTLQQLRDVFNCLATDWSQVGGAPGPIVRFIPQLGSGTGPFFFTNVLGIPSALQDYDVDGVFRAQAPSGTTYNGITSSHPCPAAVEVQENDGTKMLLENDPDGFGPLKSNASQYNNAIIGYSAGKWVTQSVNRTNPTKDIRAGVRPGGLIMPTGIVTTPIYAVRWTGSNFFLNNATVNGTGATVQTITNAKTDGSTSPSIVPDPTLEAVGAAFDSTDIGKTLDGTCVAPGTIVTAINSASEITISPASLVTAASNCTVKMGPGAITETNPHLNSATNTDTFVGVRMLFNVVNSLSPSYVAARDIVGFDDAGPAAAKAPMCTDDGSGAGTFASDIESEGFLALPPLPSASGNVVTCRLKYEIAPTA